MTDDLLKRLLQPPFGTETSERNLMAEAAVRILELEAARAQARDDALGEAAGCIGHITRHEDLDAIFALRTKPPASAEPVTVPTTAKIMADERVRALVEAGEVMAQALRGDYIVPGSATNWGKALAQLKEPKP